MARGLSLEGPTNEDHGGLSVSNILKQLCWETWPFWLNDLDASIYTNYIFAKSDPVT